MHWLSRHFSLHAIIRNYEPLPRFFEEDKDNDVLSKYCYKKLKSEQFHITYEILNDILSEMASLTLTFQKRGLTPLEVYHLAQGKLNKLRMQYLGEKVKWSDKVSILLDNVSGEGVSVDTSSIITFINILCLHLVKDFLKMK